MKPSFLHDFNTSLYMWTLNQISKKGQTVTLQTGQPLYLTPDPEYPQFSCYSSRQKPWCGDLSLIPNIPTGFLASGVLKTGVIVDYENGRVLSSTNLGPVISGNYYSMEVGVYQTSADEEKILFGNDFKDNERFYGQTGVGIYPHTFMTPCVFLTTDTYNNTPFSLGGEDQTTIHSKAVIVSETDFERDVILGIFADSARECFPMIPFTGMPFNAYFSLTSGYNYANIKTQKADDSFYIDKVVASRLSRSVQSQIPNNVSVGFADFTISKIRYPRA